MCSMDVSCQVNIIRAEWLLSTTMDRKSDNLINVVGPLSLVLTFNVQKEGLQIHCVFAFLVVVQRLFGQ